MKVSIKFATAVILTAGALIASGSVAQAGEGGAAGSVSVIMDASNKVSQLSAAAAVGKLNAAAATLSTKTITSASAYGSGGVITLTGTKLQNGDISDAVYVGTAEDGTLTKAQANTLNGDTTISATDGKVILPTVKAPTTGGTTTGV